MYVVVYRGVVINIIEWDGKSPWTLEKGTVVETSQEVGIDWTYDGKKFHPPVVEEWKEPVIHDKVD